MRRPRLSGSSAVRGITLIEVLVTLLILAIGLLGLAGLQLAASNAQFEAFQRAQALMVAEDMASRLRANPTAARDPNSPYFADKLYGDEIEDCTGLTGTTMLVERDLCEWNNLVLGSSITDAGGGRNQASAFGARGCIDLERSDGALTTTNGEVAIRITVVWQGLTETVPPDFPCGEDLGLFGNARRAVAANLVLADLSSPISP